MCQRIALVLIESTGVRVDILCQIIGPGEGFAAVWANVWAFLRVGPYVSSRQE